MSVNPIPVYFDIPGADSDRSGRTRLYTILGDQISTSRIPDVSLRWPYNINTIENNVTTSGTGTVTTVNDLLTVSSGTTAGSVARLESVNLIRYRPGSEIFCEFTTIFTCTGSVGSQVGLPGVVQAVGLFDSNDGFAIGFNGNSQISIRWRVGGVDTWISQPNFNRDILSDQDFTKIQLWRITFAWFGGAPIFFEYLTEDGVWTAFHVIQIANLISAASVHNPTFPVTAEVVSTTSTTNTTINVGCIEGGSSRPLSDGIGDRLFGMDSGARAIATGSYLPMLSLQVVTTFQGITNKTNLKLLTMTVVLSNTTPASTAALARFTIIYNPTLTGASFTNIDSVNSVTQYDVSATALTGGSSTIYSVSCPLSFAQSVDLSTFGIQIYPGDIITVGCIGEGTFSGTLNAAVSLNWREQY